MTTITRRRFMGSAAALGAMSVIPAAAYARMLGANERLTLAVIGCGGMGSAHLRGLMERRERDNLLVVRVCDVYQRRLNGAIKTIGADSAAGTMEYREILDDHEIDAIVIATPDHWHTRIAIQAMEAGKDVYCEKPLSLTIEQAIACRDAVARTGRTLQVGPQATSDDRYWKARRAIGEGRIGAVTWSQASYCRNSQEGQFNWAIDADAGPNQPKDSAGYIWWDRWLGHEWGLAEQIPWNPDHFFRFRKYFAYNGGVATDLLYHKLAPMLLAIRGPDGEYPRRVVASGGQYIEKDGRDIPDTFIMTVDYPSAHSIVLISVMTNDAGVEDVIHGQYGTMRFAGEMDTGTTGRSVLIEEQGAWWPAFRDVNAGEFPFQMKKTKDGHEEPDPEPGKASFEIHGSPRRDHMGNFLDAVRTGAPLDCNVKLGCSTMVAIKMGVESYRQNKIMMWDQGSQRAVPG